MKKEAKVGQDVQRVRLLVKKLNFFMKTHFVNKLVFLKGNLEYVDAINICDQKIVSLITSSSGLTWAIR